MPTEFATRLAHVAEAQHDMYHLDDERDPKLSTQIKEYWTAVGEPFPGTATAWSAVFVSWCVKEAGATSQEFHFSAEHSEFVFDAIKNRETGTGVFRAQPLEQAKPAVGDIIQNNWGGRTFDYDYASKHANYHSHSAIVIETGRDAGGHYALTIGGNEGDSIRQKRVPLRDDGTIVQHSPDPYICVIQDLK